MNFFHKLKSIPFFLQKVRVAALHCLSAMCKYPTFILLPFVQDVAIGLAPALDDNKRLVRNAAVLARNQWYLIGSPSAD